MADPLLGVLFVPGFVEGPALGFRKFQVFCLWVLWRQSVAYLMDTSSREQRCFEVPCLQLVQRSESLARRS